MFILKKGHQPGVYVPLRALFLVYGVFYAFPLFFNFFINIHKYANEIICTAGHWIKEMCLAFTLVPSLIVYGK